MALNVCQTFIVPGLRFSETLLFSLTAKQCILTITRSNGSVRSYKTEPTFTRKNDAKAHAANIAVELGALEFITTGDSDALKQKKGLLLSPLDVADPESQEKEEVAVELPVDDGPVRRIESCCIEWRAGIVKPFWVEYQESKNGKSACYFSKLVLEAYIIPRFWCGPANSVDSSFFSRIFDRCCVWECS